ncbi:MAG: peptidoglycan DD-metalloendopeptidase family protein [Gemmatimonadota bacterium]|nr:peptidoglycan DD-metalloendopeptidase family protein [Gemmatimonadota bacterium]
MRRAGIFAFLLVLSMPPLVYGQDDIGEQIRRSQDRLEEIRQEQDRLAREATQMRGQIRSVGDEILNIEARIGSSTSALAEFDVQIDAYALSVDEATRDMLATRDELVIRRTELQQRLRNIYQRGRTHVLQVMLQAESFGDLISRYKYLHLVALYDRILVEDVRTLAERLSDQRERLADEYARLATLRADKRREVEDLELREDQRQRRLRNVRSQVTQAEDRISELREEERRLGSLIAELERTRREAERLAGLVSESSVTTADLGQLRWPVEGTIVYRFRDTKPGGVGSWDGIGIGAPRGTLVRAVEAGQVAWAGSRDLLGQTVIVDHGGGYWSVYLYLQDLRVRMDDRIVAGQVIGGVGGDENSEEGTHIEFQIHEPDGDNNPRLVDPVPWLRSRS